MANGECHNQRVHMLLTKKKMRLPAEKRDHYCIWNGDPTWSESWKLWWSPPARLNQFGSSSEIGVGWSITLEVPKELIFLWTGDRSSEFTQRQVFPAGSPNFRLQSTPKVFSQDFVGGFWLNLLASKSFDSMLVFTGLKGSGFFSQGPYIITAQPWEVAFVCKNPKEFGITYQTREEVSRYPLAI